jgi:hypothetical protein
VLKEGWDYLIKKQNEKNNYLIALRFVNYAVVLKMNAACTKIRGFHILGFTFFSYKCKFAGWYRI